MLRFTASALSLALLLFAAPAAACSDAGPPNRCNEGGAEWIFCSAHDDCPTGQLCGWSQACTCAAACEHGETCDEAGCRCSTGGPPAEPEPGCTWQVTSCGDYIQLCTDAAAPVMDAGMGSDAGTGGCSVGAMGSSAPVWAIGLAVAWFAGRSRRRSQAR